MIIAVHAKIFQAMNYLYPKPDEGNTEGKGVEVLEGDFNRLELCMWHLLIYSNLASVASASSALDRQS